MEVSLFTMIIEYNPKGSKDIGAFRLVLTYIKNEAGKVSHVYLMTFRQEISNLTRYRALQPTWDFTGSMTFSDVR